MKIAHFWLDYITFHVLFKDISHCPSFGRIGFVSKLQVHGAWHWHPVSGGVLIFMCREVKTQVKSYKKKYLWCWLEDG